jgi:hypothetical protein
MQVTHVHCCPRVMGEKLPKRRGSFEWQKGFNESLHLEITNKDNAHRFLRYQGDCSL